MLTLEQVINIAAATPSVLAVVRTAMQADGVPAEQTTDEAIAAKAPEFVAMIREEGEECEAAILAMANALFEAGRRAPRWVAAS